MAGSPVYSQLLGYATGTDDSTLEIIPEVPAGRVYLIHYATMVAFPFGPYCQVTITINETVPVTMLTVPWDPVTINPLVATDVRASINAGDGLFGWPINPSFSLFTVAVFGQILTGPPATAFLEASVRAPARPSPEEMAGRRRRRTSPVGPPPPNWMPIGSST